MSQDQANASQESKPINEDLTSSVAGKAKKSLDVEEGEVVDKSKAGTNPATNGDGKGEKDTAKSEKSQDDKTDEKDGDKKSKKKKKDKSKKKEKDKKSEKKADKKEKHSPSREKKPRRDKDKEKSPSRSKSRHENRKHKKRSESRSKDTRKRNERSHSRSKRRSGSRNKRRSPSYTRQRDRRRDSRDRSREQRRRSRSPVRRDRRERTSESHGRKRRDERDNRKDERREDRREDRREKTKKMEEVEDEPIDEAAMQKIESELALVEEDEEQAAARAREERKALLEKLRKTSEEDKREEETMVVEEEKKEEENKEEKAIDNKKKEKAVKPKLKKELSKPAEVVQDGEKGEGESKKMEEEEKDEEDLSPKRRATMTHKHDTDKEKYIKLIENMREKLQKEEEDLRENGEGEEGEEGVKKDEEEQKAQNVGQEFDMFCETPESVEIENEAPIVNADNAVHDDENGYYRAQIGETVNGRYKISGKLGKGVFGNVFKANDIETGVDVAMKIVKSEEIYTMSGLKEKEILTMLNQADRHNKRHVIRLHDSFEYRRHLVLVFEIMEMDLRSAIKTFGKKLGLSIESVRSYARQLFIALAHLKKYKIIHADLKPDNILVTNNQKTLKLSDFGSAFPVEENTITPYLVARYYRAPEIILGCPYDTAVDTWSAACTIFELYTGKMLFPGRDNNEMLKLIMQTKGRFNNKMLKRGEFSSQYFDHQNNFLSTEIDPVTKLKYVKPIPIGNKITRDIGNLLNAVEIELSDEDRKKIVQLKDLLERCLTLEPNRRISPDEVLRHPFINYTVQKLAVDQNTIKHVF